MNGAQPFLIDVVRAGDVINELGEHVVLHAGPPIDWDYMCGPMRGAVAGDEVYEGWADSLDAAMELQAQAPSGLHQTIISMRSAL